MGGVYGYDGSFAGLLTLLARIAFERVVPDAIGVDPPRQQGLFGGVTSVETDEYLAGEFWSELCRRLPPSGLTHIRQAFLADHEGREEIIRRYLLLAREVGKGIGGMLAHPHVAPLWKLARQVGSEAHRYKGFVRFRETAGGFYYSAISPDHRILPLIAPHFAARFSDQQWVIHDEAHGEGIVHDRNRRQWLIIPMEVSGDGGRAFPVPVAELFRRPRHCRTGKPAASEEQGPFEGAKMAGGNHITVLSSYFIS
jgi:probable DNA metabolism protein